MKARITILLSLVLCWSCACNKTPGGSDISAFKGLVINEIAAHDESSEAESWVELFNNSDKDMDISGLGLYLSDQYFNDKMIFCAPSGLGIKAGEKMIISTEDDGLVTGIGSESEFTLKLALADRTVINEVSRSAIFSEPQPLNIEGSYQRIPDGSDTWRNLNYSSKGKENAIFDISTTRSTAIWVWSTHMAKWLENDAEEMKRMKALGYDHVILNYSSFEYSNAKTCHNFIRRADECGLTVHAWIQCFHNSGSWINPIDMDSASYKEDVFEKIRNQARVYIEDFGVKGIHLDYIRYPGTAHKYNPSGSVTAVGAVTRCCKELREIADSYNAGIITSAALMPEQSAAYYYGQDHNQMGKYIHILMPMIYRYSYGYKDATCVKLANYFADNTGGAECWAGITTYQGDDSKVFPMDADGITKDIMVFKESRAKGIVLFRYGLGTFPDINTIWN